MAQSILGRKADRAIARGRAPLDVPQILARARQPGEPALLVEQFVEIVDGVPAAQQMQDHAWIEVATPG